jgi:hypothetical protein
VCTLKWRRINTRARDSETYTLFAQSGFPDVPSAAFEGKYALPSVNMRQGEAKLQMERLQEDKNLLPDHSGISLVTDRVFTPEE